MYACVVHGARDLRVEERAIPRPGPGEVRVAITHGGICGSDLHYVHDGAVGDFRVRMPLVLGHEVVGVVDEIGPESESVDPTAASSRAAVPISGTGSTRAGGSTGAAGSTAAGASTGAAGSTAAGASTGAAAATRGLQPGTPVAIHPATPCNRCPECLAGRRSICRDVRFLGSAARMPHVDGGFAQYLVVPAAQVRPFPPELTADRAILTEPLAVGLHGIARAGGVAGRDVLITGAGPIGVLAAAAARALGATTVTVSDIFDEPLAVARAVGATATVRADQLGTGPGSGWPVDPDVVLEASGTAAGLASALRAVRRGGTVVQVGMLPGGDTPVPASLVVSRELDLRGVFRYDEEFDQALALLGAGLDVNGVVSASYPLDAAVDAFAVAADRRRSCKVVVLIGTGPGPTT